MLKKSYIAKAFIHEDFLLNSDAARQLYHDYASKVPIIDFHCHLSAKDIAEDTVFPNITEAWLQGDHYKWRAMRANGVDEKFCTGDASPKEKFIQWAATVPYTLRNPLYHWTHLELKRYFDIDELLGKDNASYIYDKCSEMLQSKEFSARNLLQKMNVEVVCTTDDPVDSLTYHQVLAISNLSVKVYPTFRPDSSIALNGVEKFNEWIEKLVQVTGKSINVFTDIHSALRSRMDLFFSLGCRLSDHGLPLLYSDDCTDDSLEKIFSKLRKGNKVSEEEYNKYRSGLLYFLAGEYFDRGWVQQYHVGAIRNNRTGLFRLQGADIGCDSIDDKSHASQLSSFFDKLDQKDRLAKTILYNLNPASSEVFAAMLANFNDGKIAGKMQYGAAWWFLDQKDGIIRQLNTLSNMGLLAHFVGMVTDSRSFLSYPRHEYFRRILCDLLGQDIERGELPEDYPFIGKMVQDICYYNAKKFFNF